MKPISPYGTYPAAIELRAEALKLPRLTQRRLSAFLGDYHRRIGAIRTDDRATAISLYTILREHTLTTASISHHFVPLLPFLNNVIVAEYRIACKRL